MSYGLKLLGKFGSGYQTHMYIYVEQGRYWKAKNYLDKLFKKTDFRIMYSKDVVQKLGVKNDEGFDIAFIEKIEEERTEYYNNNEGEFYRNSVGCVPYVFVISLDELKKNIDYLESVLSVGDTMAMHLIVVGKEDKCFDGLGIQLKVRIIDSGYIEYVQRIELN